MHAHQSQERASANCSQNCNLGGGIATAHASLASFLLAARRFDDQPLCSSGRMKKSPSVVVSTSSFAASPHLLGAALAGLLCLSGCSDGAGGDDSGQGGSGEAGQTSGGGGNASSAGESSGGVAGDASAGGNGTDTGGMPDNNGGADAAGSPAGGSGETPSAGAPSDAGAAGAAGAGSCAVT